MVKRDIMFSGRNLLLYTLKWK